MFRLLMLICFTPISFVAQITPVVKKNCFDRPKNSKGQVISEWQCGKMGGVVDCNEKLSYDEDSKLIVTANNGSPFSGTCETCFMNGLLERRITFVNGKENGPDTTYYKSGCPQVIRNHIQGAESGKWVFYYDSTMRLAWEMNYNLGEKHGQQLYLTKEGDTTRVENYSNGVLHGVKKLYFPNSKLEKEIHYSNGNLDGASKLYTMGGTLLQELSFKEGKKHGEQKYYYENGILLSIEHWSMDVKDGEFKTFYLGGVVQSMENYKKGILDGWFEERWEDNKLKRRAFYKKGELLEEHRYDENGVENYTFGAEASNGKEDDAMPGGKKKKSKKGVDNNNGLIKVE
jgi:antitoxin component YwqK of YwqJK toxin-antitoxin module